jgi:signal peptidase I
MSPGRHSSRSDDEDDDLEVEEDEAPRRPPKRHGGRGARGGPRGPPRRWKGPGGIDESEEGPGASDAEETARKRPPIYWRARDSLYFEPLIALAVIVVLLVGLFAFTGNWPPVYVVESDSMQHGPNDNLGLINTGDLVLAQKVPTSSITTYFSGVRTGYSTYGEYGDVILYHPDGQGSTPVIHRAIVYLEWDPGTASYSAPELNGLPCGYPNGDYATPGMSNPCATTGITGTLDLYHVGWMSVNVSIDVSAGLGDHSGYLTMGDNNFGPSGCTAGVDCVGIPDQSGGSVAQISTLVDPGWIVGVARGMIPWFGSIKLILDGNAGMVPSQSWEFMGLTIAGVILLAFGIHYALRTEGIESPLRKEEEAEEQAEHESSDDSEDVGRARRILRSLRPWHRGEEEDEEDEVDAAPSRRRRDSKKIHLSDASRRGRPRPKVRRGAKPDHKKHDDEDL